MCDAKDISTFVWTEVFLIVMVFPQREDHVTCSPDAMAPDAAKQNTLCMSYLLGEYVILSYCNTITCFSKIVSGIVYIDVFLK